MKWIFIFFLLKLIDSSKNPIYIGKISSHTNQLYKFDPNAFPICKKSRNQENKEVKSFLNNFAGNAMADVGLEFEKMVNIEKQNLCIRGMSKNNFIDMKTAINQNMYIQFIINRSFSTSVPIGIHNYSKTLFYYSHWNFTIYYYSGDVISAHASSSDLLPLSFDSDLRFTYSISSVSVSNKHIFQLKNEEEVISWYHYYSLLKIVVYMIAAIGAIGVLMIEKITKDINNIQKDAQFNDFDYAQNQFHWRLLHGDIFRTPLRLGILSSLVGVSFNLIFTFILLILISTLTSIVNVIGYFYLFLIIYSFSSFLSGYCSTSILVEFGQCFLSRKSFNTIFIFATPLLITIFLISFLTNFTLFSFTNCITILFFVFLIIVPLSLYGSYFGNSHHIISCPCEVAAIPRKNPKLPFLLRNYILFPIIGSMCSFLFIQELDFILNSYAADDKKWFLIFFATVFFVQLIFISTISVVIVYILMKHECYLWQWKTFLAPFSSSFFLFIFLVNYVFSYSMFQNKFDIIAALLISLLGSYLFGLVCGGVGFISANVFIQILFTNLKFL